MSVPTPRPPGPWRAIARDNQLNPEEKAVRDATLADLQTPTAPPTPLPEIPPPSVDDSPELRLRLYQSLIDQAGWKMRASVTEERARLEAFHPSGAAAMVTAARGRPVNAYALPATEKNTPRWRVIHHADLELFLQKQSFRGCHTPTCLCTCGKQPYPTQRHAKEAVLEVTLRRVVREHGVQGERWFYRCPDDDRVWHLTSRAPRSRKPKRKRP